MKAVVLSGGGARGAYEIGVWKALRKLKIKYDIVTGTSIGSINGMLMVQGDYYKTLHLWRHIGFDVIYDVNFPSEYDTVLENMEIYKNYAKYFLKDGGISMGKMKKLLMQVYDEKKFKNSKIDYGIVTFNLSKMQPVCIHKKDFTDDVIDYVLASSCCFPAFQTTSINGDKFIDGGYFDNMPINMAVDMGADEVIAVDLKAVGIVRPIKDKNVKVTYIRPKNDIGSFLVFDKTLASKAINYGYFDTMKVYGKLDGEKYTFKKGNLDSNYKKYSDKLINYINSITKDHNLLFKKVLELSIIARVLKSHKEKDVKNFLSKALDEAGSIFEINDNKIYNIKYYNKLLLNKINKQQEFNKQLIDDVLKTKDLKKFSLASIVKAIYDGLDGKLNDKELIALINLFTDEFIVAIYLKVIK